jgi:DNA-binding CsgD family transcriptional regulator
MPTRDGSETLRTAAVLEAADAARSLSEFMTATLDALDEHLGIRRSAFMLGLAEGNSPGPTAYAGAQHGLRPHVLEEYFERWGRLDALISEPARLAYARRGWVTIAGIYASLEPQRRRYVDDFLRRTGDQQQLSFRLRGAGWSDGYLTATGAEPADDKQRAVLAALVPSLAECMRRHLPRGLDGALSARESQVAELVALGFGNREIAAVIQIEEDTVKKHIGHATGKLGLRTRTQLAVSWSSGERLELPAYTPAPR